ncbi:MAG TPA: biopolymer transporter ExbD [Opitutae bacterium]|nr:biopolymer transporter ExbD [Opitutae bacterium]|tara:strand:+ start:359 stop:757 length:399 start_codon:yes stop_codon:yes gene_type:complete
MRPVRRNKRRRAEVNIIPLVDVLIILIFFFMMAMQFRHLTVLNIQPPKIQTAGMKQTADELVLGLDEEGSLYYRDREIGQDALEELLTKTANEDTETPVLIVADEDVPLKYMTQLMDSCRIAGLTKIRIQSR